MIRGALFELIMVRVNQRIVAGHYGDLHCLRWHVDVSPNVSSQWVISVLEATFASRPAVN